MARVYTDPQHYTDIAAAIRTKNGTATKYKPENMASAILAIETEPVINSITITENGTYTAGTGVDGYSPVTVNVTPALQSLSVTENGTYNPSSGYTGFSQVVVAVPSGIIAKAVVKVTHDVGYVCTATDGTTTIQSDTTATYLFCLPNAGTWTFSCNGESSAQTVSEYTYTEISIISGVLYRVGGKIFYIDSSVTGATYTFYDADKNALTDVRVGDTPYYYSISGTPSADKYYVFNNAITSDKYWSYTDSSIATEATGTAIGTGKSNTSKVMALSAFVASSTTIWYYLNSLRTALTGGCDDWYIPSKDEAEALRTAVDRNGSALVSWFSNTIWSSSERHGTSAYAYYGYWGGNDKRNRACAFGVRSF